ncbi:MAG: thioredoxin domain-containing protein, partial [Polyangiaceae bacterium]
MALTACGGAQQSAPKPTLSADLPVARGGSDVQQAASSAQTGEDDADIPIHLGDPTIGSRLAPVTIVEFEDFQCPFCSRAEKTMQAIEEEYGPDKLRVVWKNNPLPFHPNARPAAEAAMGVYALAGNSAFWKFHDVAFDHQADLGPEKYSEWAKLLGVDAASLQRGIAAHTWSAKIDNDVAVAKKIGSNGTPAFWINGMSLVGAQPREKFEEMIDGELHKAQAKIESGTPRDRVYAVMTAENLKLPKPSDDEDDPPADTKTVFKVPVGNSPIKGSKTALVTIVEFSDFQCPYCKRTEPTLKQIMQTYGNDVRLVWKNEPLPFHDRAEPAAELAMEARAEKGDAGFWAAHDALFDSQPDLKDSDLESVAKKIGLDVAKVKSAIKAHKYKPQIAIDEQLGDDVQASGTPHFFINGRRLVGAQPFDKFKEIIDAEIVNAKAQLAKGTAPTALYDALIKDGKGGQPPPEKKIVPASST